MKHTAGPWENEESGFVRGPDGYAVAQVYTTIEDDGSLMQANAKLIAAAPELLAASKLTEEALRNRPESTWFPIQVRLALQRAIAKAEGIKCTT